MGTGTLGSWHSREYALRWAGDDVVADMLEAPREISTALVQDLGTAVGHVVDLGSGPGAYLASFLDAFSGARGSWLDSSEAMRELAREPLARFGGRVRYVVAEVEALGEAGLARADVVVTSRVFHHLSPDTIQRTYRAIYELLNPGGIFFNLDHVGVPPVWEPRYRRVREQLMRPRKTPLQPHRHDFPLAALEQHLGWLGAAGFRELDVPWRALYTGLVVARRPA